MTPSEREFLKPGTNEAIDSGCLCPVIDNGRGLGYMGQPGIYVYNMDCPIHKKPTTRRRRVR